MLYLISPYTHPDCAVREQRFLAAYRAAAGLTQGGYFVYSPIVSGHPLVAYGLPGDWDFWKHGDWHLLEMSEDVAVLTLDGWRESIGVRAEISLAESLGKAIRYLPPEDAGGSSTIASAAVGVE